MISFPYRWMWGTIFRNLRSAMYQIKRGLKNIWRWSPIVWDDVDWDYEPLLVMMEMKLRWMAAHQERHQIVMRWDKYAKQMRVCAELCKRIREDEYWVKCRGKIPGALYCTKRGSRKDALHAEEMFRQDAQHLGKMIGKHVRKWWD